MSDDLVVGRINFLTNEPLQVSLGGTPFNKAHLDARAAEIKRLETALTEARAEIERLTGERDDALEQVEELELNADIVSDEFEKDCWKAMRQLLECCKFDWRDVDCGEGVTADRAYEYIKETIDAIEANGNRARDRALAAESELSTLRARVREVVGPFAKYVEVTDSDWAHDSSEIGCTIVNGLRHSIKLGHLRAARQLMEEVE